MKTLKIVLVAVLIIGLKSVSAQSYNHYSRSSYNGGAAMAAPLNTSSAPKPNVSSDLTSPSTLHSNPNLPSSITITVGSVSFEMVKVEAGTFTMGCTSEQSGECYSDENPCHRVTISNDYYIGKYEVTQEL